MNPETYSMVCNIIVDYEQEIKDKQQKLMKLLLIKEMYDNDLKEMEELSKITEKKVVDCINVIDPDTGEKI